MYSWIFILFFGLCSNTIVNSIVQIVPPLAIGSSYRYIQHNRIRENLKLSYQQPVETGKQWKG